MAAVVHCNAAAAGAACRNLFSLIELANRSSGRDPPITEKEEWNCSRLAPTGEIVSIHSSSALRSDDQKNQ